MVLFEVGQYIVCVKYGSHGAKMHFIIFISLQTNGEPVQKWREFHGYNPLVCTFIFKCLER